MIVWGVRLGDKTRPSRKTHKPKIARDSRCYSASIDVSDNAGVGWKVVGRHGCYGRGAGLTSGNERVKWAGVPFFTYPSPH
jgi:hypothetical protein